MAIFELAAGERAEAAHKLALLAVTGLTDTGRGCGQGRPCGDPGLLRSCCAMCAEHDVGARRGGASPSTGPPRAGTPGTGAPLLCMAVGSRLPTGVARQVQRGAGGLPSLLCKRARGRVQAYFVCRRSLPLWIS